MNKGRLESLVDIFPKHKIDALFVSNPANIFYLTGLSQFVHPGDAYLLICKGKIYLFTSALYSGGVGEQKKFGAVSYGLKSLSERFV